MHERHDHRGTGCKDSGRRATPRAGARAVLVALAAVVLATAAGARATPEERALLAGTNLFATVPEQFHARLEVNRADWLRPLHLELWRGGRDRMLARVLDPRQAGRFLLQIGAAHYLIAPGARQPVTLGAAAVAGGAGSFEQLLGIDVERDFEVDRVETSGAIVTFHLTAVPGTATARATPRARWVVDRSTRLPLRADIVLADGRTARVVEFAAFSSAHHAPTRLTLKDVLRGGPPTVVEVKELAATPVADGLFSLTDGTSRALLPPVALPE